MRQSPPAEPSTARPNGEPARPSGPGAPAEQAPPARRDAPIDTPIDSLGTGEPLTRRVTLRTLDGWARRGLRFACLTAYDATTARWLERGGVPVLLVGDTAAEIVLGHRGTIHAPLDVMLFLTAAVRRGAPRVHLMGDMPFMSYQAGADEAMRNAGRFLTEGQADSIKLEVDGRDAPLIERMTRAGIPVVAHIGCRPQQVRRTGYRTAGTTPAEIAELVDDARRLEEAGAAMILIEATPDEAAQAVIAAVDVPVIGCGAGPSCHGQIVVTQDLLGMTDRQPSFARPLRELGPTIAETAADWTRRVAAADLGEHPYSMRDAPAQANPSAE